MTKKIDAGYTCFCHALKHYLSLRQLYLCLCIWTLLKHTNSETTVYQYNHAPSCGCTNSQVGWTVA